MRFLDSTLTPRRFLGGTIGRLRLGGAIIWQNTGSPPGTPTIYLSITSVARVEGQSGATAFVFNVSRSGQDLSVASSAIWTVAGTGANPATASDFVGGELPTGTVYFAPGETQQTITVSVQGDQTNEEDETFTITLSAPVNASLGTASAVGTIINDDGSEPPPPVGELWDMSGLQLPPVLNNPVIFGGPPALGGQPWPALNSKRVYEFNCLGRDALIMPPYVGGDPIKLQNVGMKPVNFLRLHILGVHIEITNPYFGRRRRRYPDNVFIGPDGTYLNNQRVFDFSQGVAADGNSNIANRDLFLEGVCFDNSSAFVAGEELLHECDVFNLFRLGRPENPMARVVFQNTYAAGVGTANNDDVDNNVTSTDHADVIQTNARFFGKTVYVENFFGASGYQMEHMPYLNKAENGGWMGNVLAKDRIPPNELSQRWTRVAWQSIRTATIQPVGWFQTLGNDMPDSHAIRVIMSQVYLVDKFGGVNWDKIWKPAGKVVVNGSASIFTTVPQWYPYMNYSGAPVGVSSRNATGPLAVYFPESNPTVNVGVNYVSPHARSRSWQLGVVPT